ncbi:stalk domain-containing protein [Paenibacillus ihuae]|uniref:stalk domain-containing protein n=1 Tax=Paenibacillus ihuae TaxID=1232431 RepID=UPI0006D52D57|nr:stalk domain-containing protein [Paenibacillus ihuae]
MNHFVRRIRALLIFILVAAIGAGTAFAPARTSAAGNRGEQLLPLFINDSYVLFPGKLSPYIKDNKLMMPIRAFSDVIGARLTYNSTEKSYTFSFMGQSVSGLKAGVMNAVFDNGLEAPLGVKPEMKEGTLFVPMSSVLETSKSIRWENMGNRINKVSGVIDGRRGVILPQNTPVQLQVPFVYTTETFNNIHPLFPVRLNQTAVTGGGYKLQLETLNNAPFNLGKNSVVLELVAVDFKGSSKTLKGIGPEAKTVTAGASSFIFNVPTEAEYVIFRSHTK